MGVAIKQPDLAATIMNVRSAVQEMELAHGPLTLQQALKVEESISEALKAFDGDHALACQILINYLHSGDIPGFQDSPHSVAGHTLSQAAIQISKGILEPLRDGLNAALDAYLDENPLDWSKT